MTEQEWGQDHARALAVYLSGDGLNEDDGRGRPVLDDSFLLLFNADANEVRFVIPPGLAPGPGLLLLDTSVDPARDDAPFDPAQAYALAGRSLALVRFERKGRAAP